MESDSSMSLTYQRMDCIEIDWMDAINHNWSALTFVKLSSCVEIDAMVS